MTALPVASPVTSEIVAIQPARRTSDGWQAGAQVVIDPAEPVLAGHYPGFPIFPGVCVLECVHRAARLVPPPGAGPCRFHAVESARLLAPVFPGDRLYIDIAWSEVDGAWRCGGTVRTARGSAATVRLRYAGRELVTAEPAFDTSGVRDLLPHRYPIRLLDRVSELIPGQRTVALKAVTCTEPWFAALDREDGEIDFSYPEALIQESWTQAAGVLAAAERPSQADEVMLAGAVSDLRFVRRVQPGDVLRHEVIVERSLPETLLVRGTTHVGEELVCTVGRMVLAFRHAAALRPDTTDTAVPRLEGSTR